MCRLHQVGLAAVMAAALAALPGCGPAWKEVAEETNPNEAVFIYSLEGNTLKNQAKIDPTVYSEAKKVASRRIIIDQRVVATGRWWQWWAYEYKPTQRVERVSLTPVTREWTPDAKTGTAEKNQALEVESRNSINYALCANLRCAITKGREERFLTRYSGQSLAEVVDTIVWGYAQARTSYYCGQEHIDDTLGKLGGFSDKVFEDLTTFFEPDGITIENFGFFGGILYDNNDIQEALNQIVTASNDKAIATQEQAAQRKQNEILLQKVAAERRQALALWNSRQGALLRTQLELMEKDVAAAKAAVGKWDGGTPSLVPDGSDMTSYFFGGQRTELEQIKELVNTKSEKLDQLAAQVASELKVEAEARARADAAAKASADAAAKDAPKAEAQPKR
jgi:septum formation inhibitor MinC